MKNLKTNWLVRHAITVFSCVLIIVFGIAFISRAVPVTTTIGENIATNDLSVAGNVTSGTWQGTAIGAQYGGTGADFSGSTGLVKLTGGTASMITDGSANWDAAYAYSQIMHLPLAGGTLTGGLTVDGVTGLVDSDIPDAITASNYLPLTGGTLSADLILQETGDAKITIHSNTDTPTADSKLLVVQKGTTPTELFSVDEDGDAAVANDLAISGNVGIGTATPEFRLTLDKGAATPDGGILSVGTYGSGTTLTTSGAGTKLIWYPQKAAFRAGYVSGTQWDNANIGNYSAATGYNTRASGLYSTAIGYGSTASGTASFATAKSTASGLYSVAMGESTASQNNAFAMGWANTASGDGSVAMGWVNAASNYTSVAMGAYNTASGAYSAAVGKWLTAGTAANTMVLGQGVDNTNRLVNNTASSLMVGFNSTIPTLFVGPSVGAGTTGNVGIGTAAPSATALLDVSSTTKGFLPPRMTTIQRDAISSPSAGLMIYNTDTNKLNFYNNTVWEQVTSGL